MPCAIGRREAEQPRARAAEVWIGLRSPETARVVRADAGRHPPAGRWRPAAPGASPRSRRVAAAGGALLAEVRRDAAPHLLAVDRADQHHVELPAPLVRAQVLARTSWKSSVSSAVDRPVHGDPVGHVHQADQREREVRTPSSAAGPAGTPMHVQDTSPAAGRSAGTRRPGRSRARCARSTLDAVDAPARRPAGGPRRRRRGRQRPSAPAVERARPRHPGLDGRCDGRASIRPPAGSGRRPGPRCR